MKRLPPRHHRRRFFPGRLGHATLRGPRPPKVRRPAWKAQPHRRRDGFPIRQGPGKADENACYPQNDGSADGSATRSEQVVLAISGRVTDLLMAIQEISTVIFEIQVQCRLTPAGGAKPILTGMRSPGNAPHDNVERRSRRRGRGSDTRQGRRRHARSARDETAGRECRFHGGGNASTRRPRCARRRPSRRDGVLAPEVDRCRQRLGWRAGRCRGAAPCSQKGAYSSNTHQATANSNLPRNSRRTSGSSSFAPSRRRPKTCSKAWRKRSVNANFSWGTPKLTSTIETTKRHSRTRNGNTSSRRAGISQRASRPRSSTTRRRAFAC